MSVSTETTDAGAATPAAPDVDPGGAWVKAPAAPDAVGAHAVIAGQPESVLSTAAPAEAAPPPENSPPGAIVPDPPRAEGDRLDPQPVGPLTLDSGTQVEIRPLHLRETMRLLRIVTRGAGGYLGNLVGELDFEQPEAFAQTLGMIFLMAIPEAEQEAVDFIKGMCTPAGVDHLPAKERLEFEQALHAELDNPSLNDVTSVIEAVIRRESEDIRSLGKRIGQAFNLAARTGQLKNANASTPKG